MATQGTYDSHVRNPRWHLSVPNFSSHAAFVLWSFIFLYPVLSTPLVADDFAGPFYQFGNGGSSLRSSFRYGLDAATGGVNFRLIGMPIGSIVHYWYIWLAAELHVPIVVSYALTKFALLLTCCYLAAFLCHSMLKLFNLRAKQMSVLFVTGSMFFGTLQIHGLWSNDPVASYPLAGYGSCILMLTQHLVALKFVLAVKKKSVGALLTFIGVISIFYYEMTIASLVAISMTLSYSFIKDIRRSRTARQIVRSLFDHVQPFVVWGTLILVSRLMIARSSSNYDGTTVRLTAETIRTLVRQLMGALPTSAWGVSYDFLPADALFDPRAIAVILVVMALAVTSIRSVTPESHSPGPDRTVAILAAISLVASWLLATLMQSITVKVQNETPRIGFVYTNYAVGSVVLAVVASCGFFVLIRSTTPHLVKVPILTLLLVGLVLQWNINWRLSDQMNRSLVPNRILLQTFSSNLPIPERCKALMDWSNGPWPDYYELGMIDGLQDANARFRGEPFCPNFIRPIP